MESMRCAAVFFILFPALFAQPDARELVRQSIQNGERSWRDSFSYACVEHDVTRRLGDSGRVKLSDDDVYDVIPLGYNTSYSELVSHDGEPVPKAQLAKERKELARLEAETPAEKAHRFEKEREERAYMLEVPDAFDFTIAGVENLPTGPAWIVDAVPHPGYQARSRYGRMFRAMKGRLWIDKKDLQWVKADAVAMEDVSFGFFIARLARGSHILLEQQKLPDGAWVPKDIQARASARLFVFFNHNFEENISYSEYHKTGAAVAATHSADRAAH